MKSINKMCELCGRSVDLTFHHLIPRKLHRRTHYRKHYSKETLNQGVHICRPCHSGIHKLYDEMTLAKRYNSLILLKNDDSVSRHVAWVKKQKT